MKFSINKVEYESQWGSGSEEDKDFITLEELVEFIKEIQADGGYIYRFIAYDPPRYPNKDYTGYITICESDE